MQDPHKRRQYKRKRPYYSSFEVHVDDLPEKEEPVSVVGCTGKHRYSDIIAAHAAAHHMCSLLNTSEVYLYHCDNCGGYHLTKAKVSPDGKLNRWAYYFGKD